MTMTEYSDPANRRLIDEPTRPYGIGYFQKEIGVSDNFGIFSFCGSEIVSYQKENRCDDGWWGPAGFHKKIDGVCTCSGIDTDELTLHVCEYGVMPLNVSTVSIPFYSAPPIGYIIYQELKEPEMEEIAVRRHWNGDARTLQELFKLMFEWKDCAVYLNDKSDIATTANGLINEMQVPESIESWVRSEVPDQPVQRFLLGDPNARDRAVGVPDMTDEMSHWLWTKVIQYPMTYGPGSRQP